MASIKFSPKDIFEQDFKTSMRGYSKEEVDEFLDDVIRDYEAYEELVKTLREENSKLKEELKTRSVSASTAPSVSPKVNFTQATSGSVGASTSTVMSTPKSETPRPATATTAVTNFDILKRISRLEKEVFGKQITE
ncbi:cell division regulator GpsB [Streptococcus sp.]|nr:cell division regulator GpsB [Streptococcus sp.]MDY3824428.1 cell division regulator GpsB [Streptococcus sp.]